MTHDEDRPAPERFVKVSLDTWKECLRIAAELVDADGDKKRDWQSADAHERALAFIPMIASSLHQEMNSIAAFAKNASPAAVEDSIQSAENILGILKRSLRG